MATHSRTRSGIMGWPVAVSIRRRFGAVLACCLAGLLPAACSAVPASPFTGPDPSDVRARPPQVSYSPGLGGYTSQRPVEPRPWREQNEGVAPQPKP